MSPSVKALPMKAIVYTQHGLPADDPRSLVDTELPQPAPGPHDLLVRVAAVAVNPVDTKLRRNVPTEGPACWAGTPAVWCRRSVPR